jgi:hypothetical protein
MYAKIADSKPNKIRGCFLFKNIAKIVPKTICDKIYIALNTARLSPRQFSKVKVTVCIDFIIYFYNLVCYNYNTQIIN